MDEEEKPRTNSLLIMLTLVNLLAAVAGSAPFLTRSMISNSSSLADEGRFNLLASIPAVAVVLLIVAWLVDSKGLHRRAQLIALMPLVWGMVVFVLLNSPTG